MKSPTLEVRDYKHSSKTPFVIDLRKYGQGRLFFATQTAANQELVRIKTKLTKEGAEAMNLSDPTRIAALEGERKLSKFGKDLRWAIDFALDHLKKEQTSIPFYALVAEYLEMQARINRSEIHQKDLRSRYARFCTDFGETATRVLTGKQIQDWLLDLELSAGSIRNYRTRLSSLCNYAVKKHYMDHNPVEEVEMEKVITGPPGILTPEDLSRLLNVDGGNLLPMIALAAFAGIRTAELLRLSWHDIDLVRGFVNVSATKS